MRCFKTVFVSLLAATITSCASYDFSRRNAQQGNLLPEHKIAKLHQGMTQDEVELLLSTSLVHPIFTENRMDYVYTNRKGLGNMTIKRLSLYFSNGRLVRWTR